MLHSIRITPAKQTRIVSIGGCFCLKNHQSLPKYSLVLLVSISLCYISPSVLKHSGTFHEKFELQFIICALK